ncbi:UDP-N-acetylglucosamine:LPS N-acetylglucosamine transferase [Saccharomonospora marina XMU15]|uniref:UDP-N-acetylglucosamine:LPS N-acetylglucosamine transferase n=1 Tax=Saccharomonospora marina XMU15 TaxID=882083 RepID=H5X1Q9_9PSEU|nr:wax ester/triacylglycerol synthase domain-containing protein [Saccharomonospora marina]EHR50922.1 UDP-N-acetylglucosamine:LPS N-acetylglucosamine transferase [Saccharomonospora marina XMU15]
MTSASTRPGRLLIVSANMGEGHNATGRALHEAAERLWPGVEVHWVDVLDAMGARTGPVFRRVYALGVERAPKLYQFFYASLWHYRWFARAAKAVIGGWSGRKLAPVLDSLRPDLVISTYPMGSTGLEWLRRHRGLTVPTGAWISDFAPHPSWVHTGVDVNLVMHRIALAPARRGVPGAPVEVSAPPVSSAFRPGDRGQARTALGLPSDGTVALVSCGSLGFGRADETVRELLAGDPEAHVVVVAGRNTRLRDELGNRFGGEPRVDVRGWVRDMAELMRAADVVVTNAGGATALEAIACGRAVLLHNPIAGHGQANAALLAAAGLARVCASSGELARAMSEYRRDPEALRALERAAHRHATGHRLEDGLRTLASAVPVSGSRPLRPGDALFLHVDTSAVPQHVGTVLVFEQGPELTREQVGSLLAVVPGVEGVLRRPGVLRGSRWTGGARDPRDLADEVSSDDLAAEVDRFFSEPLDHRRAVGAARLVSGLPGGRRAVLVKVHHALADGITLLQALLSRTDDAATLSWASKPAAPLRDTGVRADPRLLARGLWRLARAGRAPATPLDGHIRTPLRRHELLRLPGKQVRAAARSLGVSPTELLLALFSEALHDNPQPWQPEKFRLMVPWSLRGTENLRAAGNHTGAVSVDLPVGSMPLSRRVELVARALRERTATGVPEAAHTVVRLLGKLPPRVHAVAARWAYRREWFNAIATVMPGPRRKVHWHGAELSAAYPVLALAPGTGLAWGALTWGRWITLSFTTTPSLAPLVEGVGKHMDAALRDLAGDPGAR